MVFIYRNLSAIIADTKFPDGRGSSPMNKDHMSWRQRFKLELKSCLTMAYVQLLLFRDLEIQIHPLTIITL